MNVSIFKGFLVCEEWRASPSAANRSHYGRCKRHCTVGSTKSNLHRLLNVLCCLFEPKLYHSAVIVCNAVKSFLFKLIHLVSGLIHHLDCGRGRGCGLAPGPASGHVVLLCCCVVEELYCGSAEAAPLSAAVSSCKFMVAMRVYSVIQGCGRGCRANAGAMQSPTVTSKVAVRAVLSSAGRLYLYMRGSVDR